MFCVQFSMFCVNKVSQVYQFDACNKSLPSGCSPFSPKLPLNTLSDGWGMCWGWGPVLCCGHRHFLPPRRHVRSVSAALHIQIAGSIAGSMPDTAASTWPWGSWCRVPPTGGWRWAAWGRRAARPGWGGCRLRGWPSWTWRRWWAWWRPEQTPLLHSSTPASPRCTVSQRGPR